MQGKKDKIVQPYYHGLILSDLNFEKDVSY